MRSLYLVCTAGWGSPGEIYERGSVAGWQIRTGPNGEVLVIPEDKLESLSRYQGKIDDL